MPRSARALVVELVADVKDFVKGTQEADDALQDFVADTEAGVRDINRATDKLDDSIKDPFEKVGTSAKDAADDAERAFENLAREAKRSFDKVERSADDAGRGIGKESFGEAGSEAGSEFASNLSESISSGDYTALGRDTAAGLAAGFASIPGIGVALAAAAAGAGIVFANMQKKAEQAAELTQQAFEGMASGVLESLNQTLRGQQFVTVLEQLGGGKAGKGMEKLVDLTEKAGVNAVDFKNALINGGPALTEQQRKLQIIVERGKALQGNARAYNTEAAKSARAAAALLTQTGKVETSLAKGAEQAAVLNSTLGSKAANTAVNERATSIRNQSRDMNSMAAAQDRVNGGYTDPRINRAVAERTAQMKNQSQYAQTASRVGAPGTIVGGKRLAN